MRWLDDAIYQWKCKKLTYYRRDTREPMSCSVESESFQSEFRIEEPVSVWVVGTVECSRMGFPGGGGFGQMD